MRAGKRVEAGGNISKGRRGRKKPLFDGRGRKKRHHRQWGRTSFKKKPQKAKKEGTAFIKPHHKKTTRWLVVRGKKVARGENLLKELGDEKREAQHL